jgi:hypothetical protein
MSKRKYYYRYIVTAVSERFADQLQAGDIVRSPQKFGREHTWTFMDMRTGKTTGSFSGVFLERAPIEAAAAGKP